MVKVSNHMNSLIQKSYRRIGKRAPCTSCGKPLSECLNAASRRHGLIDEANAACFIVRDKNGQALGYFYFEQEPGRRAAANLLTKDEVRRMAVNFNSRNAPPDRGAHS
jgi:hypothetical protein